MVLCNIKPGSVYSLPDLIFAYFFTMNQENISLTLSKKLLSLFSGLG